MNVYKIHTHSNQLLKTTNDGFLVDPLALFDPVTDDLPGVGDCIYEANTTGPIDIDTGVLGAMENAWPPTKTYLAPVGNSGQPTTHEPMNSIQPTTVADWDMSVNGPFSKTAITTIQLDAKSDQQREIAHSEKFITNNLVSGWESSFGSAAPETPTVLNSPGDNSDVVLQNARPQDVEGSALHYPHSEEGGNRTPSLSGSIHSRAPVRVKFACVHEKCKYTAQTRRDVMRHLRTKKHTNRPVGDVGLYASSRRDNWIRHMWKVHQIKAERKQPGRRAAGLDEV
ncbi:hypothetical protein PG993_011038 [Apiospora rasikravindrae]|uniref:C2H2-type domain-containing protein n=1 Tax=Apiospora rasikravindrae TaxID=990691 RepID=A0ABR1SD25_9PEZI